MILYFNLHRKLEEGTIRPVIAGLLQGFFFHINRGGGVSFVWRKKGKTSSFSFCL